MLKYDRIHYKSTMGPKITTMMNGEKCFDQTVCTFTGRSVQIAVCRGCPSCSKRANFPGSACVASTDVKYQYISQSLVPQQRTVRAGCHQEAAPRSQISAVCEGQGRLAPAPPRGTSGSRLRPLLVQSGVSLAHHLILEFPGIGIFDDGLDSFSKSAIVLLMSQIILLTIFILE